MNTNKHRMKNTVHSCAFVAMIWYVAASQQAVCRNFTLARGVKWADPLFQSSDFTAYEIAQIIHALVLGVEAGIDVVPEIGEPAVIPDEAENHRKAHHHGGPPEVQSAWHTHSIRRIRRSTKPLKQRPSLLSR